MKIIFKLGYTEEDQLPRKSQYRTKQMIQLLEYLKSIPGEHLDKRCYRELSGGQQQRVLFPISVCMVCIDRRNTCYWISFDEYIFFKLLLCFDNVDLITPIVIYTIVQSCNKPLYFTCSLYVI